MGKTIMVVDDDEGILDGFEAMLEGEGYKVITSPDPDYLKSLNQDYPDLILLDVLLSGVDGREVCKRLKNNKDTKHIPIILMSAAPDVEKSAKECADNFLKKPFEMDEVLKVIKKYIVSQQ